MSGAVLANPNLKFDATMVSPRTIKAALSLGDYELYGFVWLAAKTLVEAEK